MIKTKQKYDIVYAKKPHKRNQDIIRIITRGYYGVECIISVVDGWNNDNILRGNRAGRLVADFVATEFPKAYMAAKREVDKESRGFLAAEKVEKKILRMYPAHASAVGAFMFCMEDKNIIVSIGDVRVLMWNGSYWRRMPGISPYSLNIKEHPSGCSRFFGRGELKDNEMYSFLPDITTNKKDITIMICTDGIMDMFSITDINNLSRNLENRSSYGFLEKLIQELKKNAQNDDASIVIKGKMFEA